MAGLRSGSAHWDDLPHQLGLTVQPSGAMTGLWRGVPFSAQFSSITDVDTGGVIRMRRSGPKSWPYTTVHARIEPPLGLHGLDRNYYFDRIVDYAFRADFKTRAQACGFFDPRFNDDLIVCSRKGTYESNVAVYSAIFDLLAWAAQTLQARRAQSPPPWEQAVAQAWPALAKDWGMQLDVRGGELSGVVRGRPTRARVVNSNGVLMTCVEVSAPLPAGCALSLTRQYEQAGLLDSFFSTVGGVGGEDIKLGDPAFDAAFIVKAIPASSVYQILTPAARQQLLALSSYGGDISFDGGRLTVWTKQFLLRHDQLDPFMKAAFAAALALGGQVAPSLPPAPYR